MPAMSRKRRIKPRRGGRAVIFDTDYDSLVIHNADATCMERITAAWDESFVHTGN